MTPQQWRRPRRISAESSWLTLFGFALATLYWPWISGAATTPRWLVLVGVVAMSIFAASKAVEKIDTAALLGLAFVFWAILTGAWRGAPEWYDAAWKLLLMAGLFAVGTRLRSLSPVLTGAAWGLAISSVVVVLERLGPLADPGGRNPGGLFVNGLYLAEFAAMVVAGLLALGRWRLALLCAPCLLVVHLPRGPLLAVGAAGILIAMRGVVAVWCLFLLMLMAMLAIKLRPESVIDRLETWTDLIGKLTFWGHGLGSYASGALLAADPLVRKAHANNDLLEIAYELGLPGVLLAVAFVASLFWPRSSMVEHQPLTLGVVGSSPSAAAIVVIVFLIIGLFGFPLHMPATAGLFALAAGHLARGETR